jgi:hypothetical protein
MSPQHIRVAALWLRAQAQRQSLREAEVLNDRRHRPRRNVEALPRDTKGRWTRANRAA